MRRTIVGLAVLAVVAGLALAGLALNSGSGMDHDPFVDVYAARPAGQCSPTSDGEDAPQPDLESSAVIRGVIPAGETIQFLYNPATFPVGVSDEVAFVAAVNAATGAWEAPTVPARQLFADVTIDTDETDGRRARRDGESIIAFSRGTRGAAGLAFVFRDPTAPDEIDEVDIILSSAFDWTILAAGGCDTGTAAFDVQNALTHELAHATGLADLLERRDAAQSAFGFIAFGERYKRTLASGDDAAVAAIYNLGSIAGVINEQFATVTVVGTNQDASSAPTTYAVSDVPPGRYTVVAEGATGTCTPDPDELVVVEPGAAAVGPTFDCPP